MPRLPRIDSPGLLHHIIARGIERRRIFIEQSDYADFLARIETSLEKSPQEILAWCLMPNHFHLLVRSGKKGMVDFMRRLMAGYATAFNARHQRVGHLFQNRYKSIVCDEDGYLLELVRYIHLNPVRAGIVKSIELLRTYPYTGHAALMGTQKNVWQKTQEVLSHFSAEGRSAHKRCENFLREGLGQEPRTDLLGGGLVRSAGGPEGIRVLRQLRQRQAFDSRILGTGEFVEQVLKSMEQRKGEIAFIRRSKIGISAVAQKIALEKNIPVEALYRKGRTENVSQAKSMLIYAGVEYFGKRSREMARLTRMSDPAASKARERGAILFENNELARWLKGN